MDYPGGAVTGLEPGTGEPLADPEAGVSAAVVILGLAGAYHVGQTRLALSTQRAARDLWLRMRPITDQDLADWLDAYDSVLAGAARQQAGLTSAYIKQTTGRLGAMSEPLIAVPASDAGRVSEWLQSPQGQVASQRLRTEVSGLLDRGSWTADQRALYDRIAWMHSPVVKRRWHQSEGIAPDDAVRMVAASVEAEVDAGLRAVEADVMGAVNWPTFKTTGAALLYKRVPQAGACGWCRVVATRLYGLHSFKSGRAWHVGCRCVWAPVTYREAKRYTQVLGKRGDYYAAARDIGLWDGDQPVEGARFDAQAAAAAGYESRTLTADERATLAAQRAARTARTTRTASGQRARATVAAAQPGQVTAERLASIRLQIAQLQARPGNAWAQQRLVELLAELDTLIADIGA